MSTIECLRATAEQADAPLEERAKSAVQLLEEDEGGTQKDLRLSREVIEAVAKASGPDVALRLNYRLSSEMRTPGFEAVVAAWPEQTPQEFSLVAEPHQGITKILATLKREQHVYGALVAEYRYNIKDPFFLGSAMFQCVWGRHIVDCFRELGEEAFSTWLRKMRFVDRSGAKNVAHVLHCAGIAAPPDPLRECLLALARASV